MIVLLLTLQAEDLETVPLFPNNDSLLKPLLEYLQVVTHLQMVTFQTILNLNFEI